MIISEIKLLGNYLLSVYEKNRVTTLTFDEMKSFSSLIKKEVGEELTINDELSKKYLAREIVKKGHVEISDLNLNETIVIKRIKDVKLTDCINTSFEEGVLSFSLVNTSKESIENMKRLYEIKPERLSNGLDIKVREALNKCTQDFKGTNKSTDLGKQD